ncbi:Uncharacterised protein [Mycobacteroides abscessus subsp. abscessus]|nr:Uncharacterised protein [Mycobacteroides abscessus subsp. abscessus]
MSWKEPCRKFSGRNSGTVTDNPVSKVGIIESWLQWYLPSPTCVAMSVRSAAGDRLAEPTNSSSDA